MMADRLLDIDSVWLRMPTSEGDRTILQGVNLTVSSGEAVGLVGESGSGKSMTARTVFRLHPPGAVVEGRVQIGDKDVYRMTEGELRACRRHDVAMIYQDARSHINPLRNIGDFLLEGMVECGTGRKEAEEKAVALLEAVGIPDGRQRMREFPDQLSGGLLQRVMIAAALSTDPKLLIADEATTALDVTTQEEVVAILDDLRRSRSLALLFVTHDLDLAAAITERIAVMYAGLVVEVLPSADLEKSRLHPYTAGLLDSRPTIGERKRIQTIPGRAVPAYEAVTGCVFAPRCRFAVDRCREERPELRDVGDNRVACHFAEAIRASGELDQVMGA